MAGVSSAQKNRENLAQRRGEHWRPPPLEPGRKPLGQAVAKLRRFLDLQAGSVWADVAQQLRDARGKLVDVGCGAQPYRALIPAGVEYVGLDIADSKARFGYQTPDTLYFDGTSWPEATHEADWVLCTEVLEHLLDPRAFLREAYAALRPGGRLVLTVPFAARWHFVPFDYWRFTPSALAHLLDEAGFGNVRVWARGNALTVSCYKNMALLLPLLFPQAASGLRALPRRVAGAASLPLLLALAVAAHLSLRAPGGEDCLGFTVLAERPKS
jgi:SAM-dependent methyltransferase